MASDVTWESLRDLAAVRAANGCAVSVYVDLDPSTAPTPADAETRINSVLADGSQWLEQHQEELDHEARTSLRDDLERVRTWFDEEFDRDGARGLAVFADGGDGFWRPLALAATVPDRIEIGKTFAVSGLAPLVGQSDGAIVAVIGRERGELYRLRGGTLVEIADLSDDAPGQHDQGGWSQARYERHIEKLVQEHLGEVAEAIDKSARRTGSARIVVVGTDQNRKELLDALSNEARAAVVGEAAVEAHATAPQVLEAVLPVLQDARAAEEAEALERWREGSGRGARASSGWAETLEAASDAKVELLLYRPGVAHAAYECPQCGRAAAEPGSCPLDGTPMEERADGLDVALRLTLVNGGTALAVEHHQDLDPVEGIGALLRF